MQLKWTQHCLQTVFCNNIWQTAAGELLTPAYLAVKRSANNFVLWWHLNSAMQKVHENAAFVLGIVWFQCQWKQPFKCSPLPNASAGLRFVCFVYRIALQAAVSSVCSRAAAVFWPVSQTWESKVPQCQRDSTASVGRRNSGGRMIRVKTINIMFRVMTGNA